MEEGAGGEQEVQFGFMGFGSVVSSEEGGEGLPEFLPASLGSSISPSAASPSSVVNRGELESEGGEEEEEAYKDG